jgi:hypothetical protein
MVRILNKKIKKAISIASLFFIALHLQAQSELEEALYSMNHVLNYVGASIIELADPYLSVLNYNGYGAWFEYNNYRYFNPSCSALVEYSRLEGLGALTLNPQSTALITYLGANTAYGVLYEYRDIDNIVLHAGGNVDVDFGMKIHSRNVNNPYSMDLATNLNGMLGFRYMIPTKRRILNLSTQIEFPMMGCMFVPYPGLSYYEIYNSKKIGETIHFSSFHNKQGIIFNMPFKHSSWSVGVLMHLLKYQTGEQPYKMNEFSVFFGIQYDFIKFSGWKSNKPENFVSPGL